MMSKNSENHMNNGSVEQNVGAAVVAAAAVAATTSDSLNNSALSKQRKKRKKRRDNLPLTSTAAASQATPFGCSDRIENSCNSISTCSNCAQCACVYCHFNELASRKNCFVNNSSQFECDYRCKTGCDCGEVNFWPNRQAIDFDSQQIPFRHDNYTSASNNNNNCCLRAQRTGHSVNRRVEQLQRFAIYENLCGFCGFAIGNGSHHIYCNTQQQQQQLGNELSASESANNENIYENICESCHLIFDGVQCTSEICTANRKQAATSTSGEVIDVLVKKPPIANRQFGKQFSEFLGSFKQKLKEKTPKTVERKPKIEIVHNFGEVFKTNTTFDLNEIVRLKNQSANSVVVENSGYGKLIRSSKEEVNGKKRSSEEHLSRKNQVKTSTPKPRLVRSSTSESNFFKNYPLSSQLQSTYAESIASDTILYSNSYAPPSYEDAIQNSDYTRVSPFPALSRLKPKTHNSTSASSFSYNNSSSASTLSYSSNHPLTTLLANDNSLRAWMTSLKQQTHDYSDDNRQFECDAIKTIPSKMFNSHRLKCSNSNGNDNRVNMSAINANNKTEANLLQRIESFKVNLMEHRMHSKRNAIYIKDAIVCDDSVAEGNGAANIETDSMLLAQQTPAPEIDANIDHDDAHAAAHTQSICCNLNRSESVQVAAAVAAIDEIVCLRPKNRYSKCLTGIPISPNRNGDSIDAPNNNQHNISHVVALATTQQYLQMLKAFYMTQIALSASLNRLVLLCGDNRLYCLVNVLLNSTQSELDLVRPANKLVRPTKSISAQQIIEILYKMSITKQLQKTKKQTKRLGAGRKSEKRFEDFVKRSTNLLIEFPLQVNSDKCSLDDFVVVSSHQLPCGSMSCEIDAGKQKSIDDFSKPTNICNKSLNDFAKKKTHYSSSTPSASSTHNSKHDRHRDENIYQPIWMFKTIGTADETSYDEDLLNNFDNYANVCDEATIDDGGEWEVAEEEFLFSSNRIDSTEMISHSMDGDARMKSPFVRNSTPLARRKLAQQRDDAQQLRYQNVCVLYNPGDTKWNKIIYDYNGNSTMFNANIDESEKQNKRGDNSRLNGSTETIECTAENYRKKFCTTKFDNSETAIKFDSVNAWKTMLRTVDYMEDEEDVILSESYLLDKKSAEYNNQNNQNIQAIHSICGAGITSATIDDDSASDTTKSSVVSERTEDTDLSSNVSTTPPTSTVSLNSVVETKSKKESGFLNKLQYRRFDITKNTSKKDDTVQGLFYKNLNGRTHTEPSPPMEIKKLNRTGMQVFGVDLDDVEKDEEFVNVPKFVVECIKIIELEENMQTNGIYRASGKKDSIDKLRKKMNESKLRRGTKYVSLKDEDVHTITGALKQFFRELKTELIPSDIVKHLPNDLENDESLVQIRNELNAINTLPRETLKYLLKHLARVDANKEHNLMNASNLSIVWGATIFTSVNMNDTFETSDLMRKNALFRVLIQRFDEIFGHAESERLI